MTKRFTPLTDPTGVLAGATLILSLTGCLVEQPSSSPRPRPVVVQAQAPVIIADDYDYYPGYETYYSRNRREFVYREGNTWVRRPQPRGVSIDLLFSTPVVHLDFHDAPEQHDSVVVRSYPRNWTPPNNRPESRDVRVQPPRGDTHLPPMPVAPIVAVRDDYDYYPAYETYYSRSSHDYVYREGNQWVHRPEPRSVKREVLMAAPVVHLDFHDSPEQHHAAVVKQYPKNWKQPDDKHDAKDDRKDDDRRR